MIYDNIESIQIIGAAIQVYGHFEVYTIPYGDGKSIVNEADVTKDEFLRLTYEYFTNKNRINYDYGDDLKHQNQVKKFIRDRINCESLSIGDSWMKSRKFKL